VFDDYFAVNREIGHRCATGWDGENAYGFVYFAPVEMTDRTWSLYWIVVDPTRHARGLGTNLLQNTEETIRKLGGRILLIETSALPHYEPTRRFYLKHGYDQEARIRDYYSEGDDLIMFRKKLG
jgi:ribosomal protein S18 acetylase RimI-like enzyme